VNNNARISYTLNDAAIARICKEIAEAFGVDDFTPGQCSDELSALEERMNAGETPTAELKGRRDAQGYTVHVSATSGDFHQETLMNHATIVTLHINRLRECCLTTGTDDEDALFDATLPSYIERLTAAMPAGVSLEIDETGTGSLSSLTDDDNNDLAHELNSQVQFWS
jgi:hypothetical protein